jgi:glycosyltransferase involved in cell wall biosynthesis
MKFGRVLLSAFACDPGFGSDEEVGWQWAKQLSERGMDVTVITRRAHQAAIEEFVAKMGQCACVKFVYVDMDGLHAALRRFNRRNHLYYYFWQWQAYKAAKYLHALCPFDLIHHVTWVSFRQPSFMGLVGAPFYFGPVAGGDEIPAGYTSTLYFGQKLVEFVRGIANAVVRFDPLMQITFRQAHTVFFTSTEHLARVPAFVRDKSQIQLAIGMSPAPTQQTLAPVKRQGKRLLFVGRCIGWKGMGMGLHIFAQIHRKQPDVTLTIVGDGVDRTRWMALSAILGVAHAVVWRGWLSKASVLDLYQEFDLLFYPSLRDSGGFVVLEALQCGLPVVCFKLGGPGVVVNDSCGAAVEALADIQQTKVNYANAVLSTLARVNTDSTLSNACRARVNDFTWDALIQRIYGPTLDKKSSA